MNTCPNCGMVKGIHASILPGCMCRTTPQNTFTPDWDAMAVMVEEQQRMAKRIEDLETEQEPLTEREIELIDGMIEVQLHHASQCDRINNRTMAEKQKGWDMERVELLRKLKEKNA